MNCFLSNWSSFPESYRFDAREVHVWKVGLEREAVTESDANPSLAGLRALLSPDERKRADRFMFRKDREAFVLARASLRMILGRYLGKNPHRIRFHYGPHGKPYLKGDPEESDTRFNVSHTHGLVLVAVTRGREVGVDVENVFYRSGKGRADREEKIPERFFSPREVASLRALPKGLQEDGFYACWTRKEAYIKAKGGGMSIPLDGFEVSLAPGERAALLDVAADPDEAGRWRLEDLRPGEGFVGALAVEGRDWDLKRWRWRPLG